MKRLKENKAITLIALIITVIVLLIIAGIVINMMLGDNKLFNKAEISAEKYQEESIMEETRLAIGELQLEILTDKTVNTISMADYVVQKNQVVVGNGKIYEEAGEYYYENKDGTIVELYEDRDTLKVEKIISRKGAAVSTGKVMYHANEGNGDLPSSSRVEYGQTVTVDTEKKPTREGYNFLGWALTNDATTPIADFTMPERDVTIYAVWQKVIIITYNSNGGTGIMEPTKAVEPKVAANGFTAPKEKMFKEWNTELDGSGTSYKKDDTVNDDLVLYAIWIQKTEFNFVDVITNQSSYASYTSIANNKLTITTGNSNRFPVFVLSDSLNLNNKKIRLYISNCSLKGSDWFCWSFGTADWWSGTQYKSAGWTDWMTVPNGENYNKLGVAIGNGCSIGITKIQIETK